MTLREWMDAGLSLRAANVLVGAGCETIADVKGFGHLDLFRLPGAGKVTVAEIEHFLARESHKEMRARRRIIQLVLAEEDGLFALCDDGSVWLHQESLGVSEYPERLPQVVSHWKRLADIPQEEP